MRNLLLIFSILLSACVEHQFLFTVSPEGNYEVKYKAHGDKNDLTDFDFPLPKSKEWDIHTTFGDSEAETFDYTANRNFKRNEKFPDTFFEGDSIYMESLISHPIRVIHRNWVFIETFSFYAAIEGRGVHSKYPLVNELIQNSENPPEGWLKESLYFLLSQTLSESDVEWNTKPIIRAELKEWVEIDLAAVSDSKIFEDFEYYKNEGLDIIMQPVPPENYDQMDTIFKILEDELEITLALIDDQFDFRLVLPGMLEHSNADTLSGDTLFWSFNLKNFSDENFIMEARSSIDYPGRQKAGLFILFIFIIGLIGFRRKTH
jgi:hypothetical protein